MSLIRKTIIFSALAVMSFSVHSASAKSLPQDNPTPLESREIGGDVEGKQVEEKFFRFSAGPGTVVMTLDMKTESGTMIDFDFSLMDARWKKLAGHFDVLGNSATKRVVKEIKLKKKQTLILKITTKPSWGSGSYRVKFDGALDIKTAD